MRSAGKIALVILLASCGPSAPTGLGGPTGPTRPPVAETCATTLAPRAAPVFDPPPARAIPTLSSRLVAVAELRLAPLAKELDAKTPRRVAEERGRDVGIAGSVDYTVDRGPFSVAVEGENLVVRTDLHAHAQVVAKGRAYASCDPVARATATIPLHLTPAYRFPPSQVKVAFVQGCAIRALFVRVDVTPTIEQQLGPSLRRIEHDIDARLPPVRPEAERIWAELGKARPIPLGGCAVVAPRGIVQGHVTGNAEALRARFALLAEPELRRTCGVAPKSTPLPPLAQDPSLSDEDDLVVGLVAPLEAAARAMEGTNPVDLGKGRSRITRAKLADAAGLVDADLSLRGEVCGEIASRATLGWARDGKSLELSSSAFSAAERERASGLDPKGLDGVAFPAPMDPTALGDILPDLAKGLSDPQVDVTVNVSSEKPLDAFARDTDVVARVVMRGSVLLKER